MAKYVKGDSVTNATSYELYEKVGSNYNLLNTKNEIDFNLDELVLDTGDHTLVVKAKADGYEDSDYSNEVTYTVSSNESGTSTLTIVPVPSSGVTVSLVATGYTQNGNSITVPTGTEVSWSLFKSGSHRYSGKTTVNENMTKEVKYAPTGTFTNPDELKTFDTALFMNGSFNYGNSSVYANNKKRVISASTQYANTDICLAEINSAYTVEVLYYANTTDSKYHSRIEMCGSNLLPITIPEGSYYRLHIKLASETDAADPADIPTFVNAIKYYV